MNKLLESILEGIMAWILNCVVYFINFFSQLTTNQFGMETSSFKEIFDPTGSFLPQVIDVFIYTGVGLCLVMLCWNLFKSFFGPLASVRENPLVMVGKTFIAIFFSLKGIEIIETLVFTILQVPYAQLAGIPMTGNVVVSADSITAFGGLGVTDSVGQFGGSMGSMMIFLLFIDIVLIIICCKFFKLVIELIERYLLMNVLVFSSPLIGCTLISEKTSSMFNGFCKMLGGQMVLMLFNVISMQLVMSGLSGALQNTSGSGGMVGSMITITLNLFAVIALLNIAQRFDTYLNQIGLNAGITGSDMFGREGASVMAAMKSVGKSAKGFGKGIAGGAGKAAGDKATEGKSINGNGAKSDLKADAKSNAKAGGNQIKGGNAKGGVHNGATAAQRIINNAQREQGAGAASSISNNMAKTGAMANNAANTNMSNANSSTAINSSVNGSKLGNSTSSSNTGSSIHSGGTAVNSIGMGNTVESGGEYSGNSITSIESGSQGEYSANSIANVESGGQGEHSASSITSVESGSHTASSTSEMHSASATPNVGSKNESRSETTTIRLAGSPMGANSGSSATNAISTATTPSADLTRQRASAPTQHANATPDLTSGRAAASRKIVNRTDMKR